MGPVAGVSVTDTAVAADARKGMPRAHLGSTTEPSAAAPHAHAGRAMADPTAGLSGPFDHRTPKTGEQT